MKVVFRADSGRHVGTGHLMRCLTLADELAQGGAEVTFVSREHPGHACDVVDARGHRLRRLAGRGETGRGEAGWLGVDFEADAGETREAIGGAGVDWLVVDHYAIDERWERLLRPHAARIFVVDDLENRRHDCDLLLDQNRLDDDGAYANLVPANARRLIGPRFAMLRPEFARTREALRPIDSKVRRVFVFFGGSDADDVTSVALRALAASSFDGEVDVVAGQAHPNVAGVERLAAALPHARVHRRANVAELLSQADLALGAGGTTTWERLCLGLPAIVVSLAENQRPVAEAVARAGAQLFLGSHGGVGERDWSAAIQAMTNRDLRESMRRVGQRLVDGRGVGRVAGAMRSFADVRMREARADDCDTIHAWRNSELVRRASLESAEIPLDSHRAWFARVVADSNRHLLVGELDGHGVGVGVVRWDLDRAAHRAEVSIYLAPDALGRGLGPALLRAGEAWLRAREPDVTQLRAVVKPENRASTALFTNAGYALEHLEFHKPLAREETTS